MVFNQFSFEMLTEFHFRCFKVTDKMKCFVFSSVDFPLMIQFLKTTWKKKTRANEQIREDEE